MSVFAREQKMLNPALPGAYPFETPFHVGFLGALFKPEKSIFLFDPLLVLAVVLCAVAWRRFRPEIRAYLIAFSVLLFAYICFYATFTVWSGDFAWGDRYVSTAAQLVAFITVPLADEASCGAWRDRLDIRSHAYRGQRVRPAFVGDVLVPARDLSNGHASAIRRSSSRCE